MSFTTTFLIEDDNHGNYTECPYCNEWIYLDDIDMEIYKKNGSIPIECYECSTIFYLEK